MKFNVPLVLAILLTTQAHAQDARLTRIDGQIRRLSELTQECAKAGAALFTNANEPAKPFDNSVTDCIVRAMERLENTLDQLAPEAKTVAAMQELSSWKSSVRRSLMATHPGLDETKHGYLMRQAQHRRVLASASSALSQQLTSKH